MNASVLILSVAALLIFAGCNNDQKVQTISAQPAASVAPSATPPQIVPNPPVRGNEIEITRDNDTAAKPIEKKKAINVKLKRSLKGEFSWDIVGTDVKEIIKTNRELQKEFPN